MQTEKNLKMAMMQFHGSSIAFEQINGKMMVNAAQMAKPFNKTPKDWLRTLQSKDLIATVAVRHKCLTNDLQVVRQGGINQGTWFHEDVALFFAQWLSPEFYLACNDKLKELLTKQALQLPEKYGITPIIVNEKVYYPYITVMNAIGGSVLASASKRKNKFPRHFIKRYGRNFITAEFADMLKGYYDYKRMSNQLTLSV